MTYIISDKCEDTPNISSACERVGATHYHGCPCHEAQRDAAYQAQAEKLARVEKALRNLWNNYLRVKRRLAAHRGQKARAEAAESRNAELESVLEKITAAKCTGRPVCTPLQEIQKLAVDVLIKPKDAGADSRLLITKEGESPCT